jgi:hypothetical protein
MIIKFLVIIRTFDGYLNIKIWLSESKVKKISLIELYIYKLNVVFPCKLVPLSNFNCNFDIIIALSDQN